MQMLISVIFNICNKVNKDLQFQPVGNMGPYSHKKWVLNKQQVKSVCQILSSENL